MKERGAFFAKLKKMLIERKIEMTNLLAISSDEKVAKDQIQDSGDEALALSMEKLQNSLEQSEIDELRLIEDALVRIDRGAFGHCVDCEENISERRLENFPYAARCIVCQEEFEG